MYVVIRTFRNDCPAMIRLTASEEGCHLVVRALNEEHNHYVNRVGL